MAKLICRVGLACVGCAFIALTMGMRAEQTNTVEPNVATAPATAPISAEEDELANAIVKLQQYYAGLYAEPLKHKDRLSRLVAVMSLSRIDGEPLTEKLLGVLRDNDLLVAQIAWEALHARHTSLSRDQRAAWITGGLDIAKKGGFPGPTLAPLLLAASERPAANQRLVPDLLIRLAEENDLADPLGRAALDQGKQAIATWSEPRLVQTLSGRLSRPTLTLRIAHLLSGLPGAPTPNDNLAETRAAYTRFVNSTTVKTPTTLPAYAGKSVALDKPLVIKDPHDSIWRKELELGDLNLDSVEIAFCIDATPSMAVSNPYVASYLDTVARLLGLMSDRVRCGVVYYRHEINPIIFDTCCSQWMGRKDDFAVKTLPLTPRPSELIAQMRQQKIGARGTGHDGNGAYAAGIETAMKAMQWNPRGKKIIACTGDAKLTPGSNQALVDLATKAKEDGFILLFITRDNTASTSVAAASTAATGLSPIIYGKDVDRLRKSGESAISQFKGTAFEMMLTRVLEQSLPEDYRSRAALLMKAAMPILEGQELAAQAKAAK